MRRGNCEEVRCNCNRNGSCRDGMGAAMGLDILSIEERKVGGECLNCGCIPSKAFLNIFEQKKIPKKLIIIGGGAIGSEMAQAFSRLGSSVNLMQMDPYLIPTGDEEAGRVLEEKFKKENT